jgi:hypothetical protein
MRATISFRIAAVLLLLFAAGHTLGFLPLRPPTAEAMAVRDAMAGVHFVIKGHTYSYGGFYQGFGFFITAFQLFSAYLAWALGGLVRRSSAAVAMIGWPFVVLQIASLVLAGIYFGAVQMVFCAVIAVCLGAGTMLAQKTPSSATPPG